jgi:hypothetical protein
VSGNGYSYRRPGTLAKIRKYSALWGMAVENSKDSPENHNHLLNATALDAS